MAKLTAGKGTRFAGSACTICQSVSIFKLCRDLWGGGVRGVRPGEDPWRLMKELWVALVEAGTSAASQVANYLRSTLALARESTGFRHGPLAFGRA